MEELIKKVLNGNNQDYQEALQEIEMAFRDGTAFRDLSDDEVHEFRSWAQENYEPGEPISSIWHPVVRKECRLMNRGLIIDPEKRRRAQIFARKLGSS